LLVYITKKYFTNLSKTVSKNTRLFSIRPCTSCKEQLQTGTWQLLQISPMDW